MGAAQHLEGLLQCWEDFCLLQSSAIKFHLGKGLRPPAPLIGAFKNWREFRKDVLNRAPFDEQKFGMPSDLVGELGLFPVVPFMIHSWSASSRRVFKITRELQALLLATSVKRMSYDDLMPLMPFPSFMIELEKPIVDDKGGGNVVDSILVISGPEMDPRDGCVKDFFRIVTLPGKVKAQPLREYDRRHIIDLAKRAQWDKLGRAVDAAGEKFVGAAMAGTGFALDEVKRMSITASLTKIVGPCKSCKNSNCGHSEFMLKIVHLVAGVCFYLQTLPSGSPHKSTWQTPQARGSKNLRAVTDEASICEVVSSQSIKPEDLEMLERQSMQDEDEDDPRRPRGEIRPGFRRGYWRRRPGYGRDPTARKVVRVKWVMVNENKLAPGTIPIGVSSKVCT